MNQSALNYPEVNWQLHYRHKTLHTETPLRAIMPHSVVFDTNAGFMVQSQHSSTAQLCVISGTLNGETCTPAIGSLHRTERRLRAKVCTVRIQREHAIFQNMVWGHTVRRTSGQQISAVRSFGLPDMKCVTRPGTEKIIS